MAASMCKRRSNEEKPPAQPSGTYMPGLFAKKSLREGGRLDAKQRRHGSVSAKGGLKSLFNSR
jgi:hypothetical protein